MNPQNFPNSMFMEEMPYPQNNTFPNYTPYLKQPLPPQQMDKRSLVLSLADLLKQNIGSVITVSAFTIPYKGVLEYLGEGYLILHDPKTHTHTILFLKDLNYLLFEDDIQYLRK